MVAQDDFHARYEIRPLELRHAAWATAIMAHSNMFSSPVWSILHKQSAIQKTYDGFREILPLNEISINSGHSMGVFDKKYRFKREESASEGGRLYWDSSDLNANKEKLLEQMDFPLVSVAMAHDSVHDLDPKRYDGLVSVLPEFSILVQKFESLDQRDKDSWSAKVTGEVLTRSGTCTRLDYEGRGIMKALSHSMMSRAADQGFRGIQIDCLSDAVIHVWSHPPEPFRSEMVVKFHTSAFEEVDADGNTRNPFYPTSQYAARIYCNLKEA